MGKNYCQLFPVGMIKSIKAVANMTINKGCTYGWAGAAGTVGGIDRQRGLRASGYTQYMPSEVYPFQGAFYEWVYADAAAMAQAKAAA